MHCIQCEQRLHELLDSRRDIDSDEELRDHLVDCSECAALAAAYEAMARVPIKTAASAGLADRVLVEINLPSPNRAISWRAWTGLAMAASLLLAVGIALKNDNPPVPDDVDPVVATDQQPTIEAIANVTPADSNREVPGRDMWYLTGQRVASISLVNLLAQRTDASEAETQSDDQLIDRALNSIRTLWPLESDSITPGEGETGWRTPASAILVA